jgi:hypothetical protein
MASNATENLRGTPQGGRVSNGDFRLGRFGGVEVRINWSWLVVFALIVWSLADAVFPSTASPCGCSAASRSSKEALRAPARSSESQSPDHS